MSIQNAVFYYHHITSNRWSNAISGSRASQIGQLNDVAVLPSRLIASSGDEMRGDTDEHTLHGQRKQK